MLCGAAWGTCGTGTGGFPRGSDRGSPSSGHLTAAPAWAGVNLSDRDDEISEETGTGSHLRIWCSEQPPIDCNGSGLYHKQKIWVWIEYKCLQRILFWSLFQGETSGCRKPVCPIFTSNLTLSSVNIQPGPFIPVQSQPRHTPLPLRSSAEPCSSLKSRVPIRKPAKRPDAHPATSIPCPSLAHQHLQHPVSLPAPSHTTVTDRVNPRRAQGWPRHPAWRMGLGRKDFCDSS